MRSLYLVLVASILLFGSFVAACAPAAPPVPASKALTIAAAADLQFAFSDIGSLFEEETGAEPTFSFGSSGTLAQQIENGAPVDVFASADEGYVERLVSRGVALKDSSTPYAIGRIALVSSKSNSKVVTKLEDLLAPEVKKVTIANPDHAPYGKAAKQALEQAGLWDRVKDKVVYGENVRQALQFVQTGNAEAGIVALSIADVPKVSYVLVDETLYQPLRQSMVIVATTKQVDLARAFIGLVNSPKGRPVMQKYGFLLPGER